MLVRCRKSLQSCEGRVVQKDDLLRNLGQGCHVLPAFKLGLFLRFSPERSECMLSKPGCESVRAISILLCGLNVKRGKDISHGGMMSARVCFIRVYNYFIPMYMQETIIPAAEKISEVSIVMIHHVGIKCECRKCVEEFHPGVKRSCLTNVYA